MAPSESQPHVHLLCGLVCAGKTTLAKRMAAELPALRFSRDEWMLRLYGLDHDDDRYVAALTPCTQLIWDVALEVLSLGQSVIMDWNHWNPERRAESCARARSAGFDVVLHYLEVPLEVAVARARSRLADNDDDAHRIDEDGVRHFATIFQPPTAAEGIPTVMHHVD
jgi:predicted kinase